MMVFSSGNAGAGLPVVARSRSTCTAERNVRRDLGVGSPTMCRLETAASCSPRSMSRVQIEPHKPYSVELPGRSPSRRAERDHRAPGRTALRRRSARPDRRRSIVAGRSSWAAGGLAAGDGLAAVLERVFDQHLHALVLRAGGERAHRLGLLTREVGELVDHRVVDRLVHVDALGRRTDLADTTERGAVDPRRHLLHVDVAEHDGGVVPTELEEQVLEVGCSGGAIFFPAATLPVKLIMRVVGCVTIACPTASSPARMLTTPGGTMSFQSLATIACRAA